MATIVHLGVWKLKADAPPEAVVVVDQRVRAFKDLIPGILASYAGPLTYFDLPEQLDRAYDITLDVQHFARGYSHGVYIVFADEAARRRYDTAQPHLDLSPVLVPILEGGTEGILSFDLTLPDDQ